MAYVYSADGKYRLTLPGDGVDGLLFGSYTETNHLETVYHYTPFTNAGIIEQEDGFDLSGPIWTSVTARVSVSSFTLSYIATTFSSYSTSQAIWVTGNTTLGAASLTFGGEHQGVFQKNMWFVRNSEFEFKRNHSTDDPVDQFRGNYEVSADHITMVRSRAELAQKMPGGYYAGFKFTPDRTTQTSITWTVNLALTGTGSSSKTTSITFAAVGQTVRNNWDRFIKEVREFVYDGKEEGAGVTTYNQGGTLTQLYNPTFSVQNSTSAGSGATITVSFPLPHGAFEGNRITVAVTSTATNHGKAQGTFNIVSVPTVTSLTYVCTSVGTVSTTTSLLGSISVYLTSPTINLPKF